MHGWIKEERMGFVGRATTVAGAVRSSRGRHPLSARITAVLPMLRDVFTGRWSDAPRLKVLAGLLGIVYVLSPIDILPELLLGPFGLGDDLAITVLSVAALLGSAEDWLDRGRAADATGTTAGEVIEGVVVERH
jgi:uncharacterized membrane protein YkvA (DUF1232 family)